MARNSRAVRRVAVVLLLEDVGQVRGRVRMARVMVGRAEGSGSGCGRRRHLQLVARRVDGGQLEVWVKVANHGLLHK